MATRKNQPHRIEARQSVALANLKESKEYYTKRIGFLNKDEEGAQFLLKAFQANLERIEEEIKTLEAKGIR